MKVLVIVPAYNEGKSIYNVVKSIFKEDIDGLNVLVINDGSLDNTEKEAERAGAKVINLPINLGIGGAVQTGYLYAYYNDYDIAVQFDGDGQHRASDLNRIIEEIKNKNCDMVIGSRFIEESSYKPSFFRNVGIRFFSGLLYKLCNNKIYDTTSGYRAINRKVIESFVHYYPKDYPEVETIAYIIKNGLKVKEIPVLMNYRTEGVSSITPIKSIYYMIKVTLALLILPKTSTN